MRTTGVRLVAQLTQYKREMRDGAKVTRDLKDEIDNTGRSSEKLGDGMSRAARAAARDVDEMRKHAAELDRQIDTTQRGLQSLAKGFANTGDTGILKAIREQQRQLRQLKNVRALLPEPGEVDNAAKSLGARLVAGIGSGLASASATLGSSVGPTVGGAIGIAAAPVLLSTLGAALSAGAGASVLGVGIMAGVKSSPEIQDAGKEAGYRFMSGLSRASRGLQGPILESIGVLSAAGDRLNADLSHTFDALSDHLVPFTTKVAGAGEALSGSLLKSARESGPALDALGDGLLLLGNGAAKFLSSMADGSNEAAGNLRLVTGAVADLIATSGGLLPILTQIGNDPLFSGPLLPMLRKHYEEAAAAAEKKAAADQAAADAMEAASRKTAAAAGTLVATQEDLKGVTQASTFAQQGLNMALQQMSPQAGLAKAQADGLKKAIDALFGAQERGIDANETYEASWDSLSESVKANKNSLDIHTKAGRANRDALEGLLVSSREMFVADREMGVGIDQATKKHNTRTEAIRRESAHLGLNKKQTDELIRTYGRIPPKKYTDIVLDDIRDIVQKMMDLYVYQRSLATGEPIGSIRAILNKEKGPAKRYGGYASGGYTGDGGKHEPAGVVHRGEWVIPQEATTRLRRENPGALEDLNTTGKLPGYASGGWVGAAPVETSTRMPYRVDMGRTKIPSREAVASKVISAPPTGGATDDWIVRVVKARFPGLNYISKYRPGAITLTGNRSYHSMHRAVDWPASHALAQWWHDTYMAKTKELITPWNELNIHNGRPHRYSGAVWNQHNFAGGNAHDHIAMRAGGTITEPIVGVGRSGTTYSFGEGGVYERVVPMNTTGRAGSGAAAVTIVMQNHGVIGSPIEVENWLTAAVDRLRIRGRL